MSARARLWSLLPFAVVLAVGSALYARHRVVARAVPAGSEVPAVVASVPAGRFTLHVPHMAGAITLDGDTDDPGWVGLPHPARTGPFQTPSGVDARPFSEVRFVWGDGFLYLSLYAADEQIESRTAEHDGPLWLDDEFRVTFSRPGVDYAVEVSPRAVVTDSIRRDGGDWDFAWSSGVHVSNEMDGTLNKADDMDEEWVIEMAVPFEAIGLSGQPGESIGFAVRRCDTPKNSPRTCAAWGEGSPHGALVLE